MQEDQPPDPYLTAAAFHSINDRVRLLEEATQRNAEAVERVETNTRDIVDLFKSLEGGFKVLQGLGRLAKPLAYIAMAVSAGIGAVVAVKGLWK